MILLAAIFRAGQIEAAWRAGEAATDIWREMNNLPMLADSLVGTAFGQFLVAGDMQKARAMAEEALEISQSINSAWGQAYTLWTLATFYVLGGEFSAAISAWENALQLSEEANFAMPKIDVPSLLSWVYVRLGAYEKGLELAHVAVEQADANEASQPLASLALALAHMQIGHTAEAQDTLNTAFVHIDPMLSRIETAAFDYTPLVYLMVFEALLACQQYDRIISIIEKSSSTVHKLGIQALRPDLLRIKAEALIATGHSDTVPELLGEAYALAKSLGHQYSLWAILYLLSRVERDKGNIKAANAYAREAKERIDFMVDHLESSELQEAFMNLPRNQEILEHLRHDEAQ